MARKLKIELNDAQNLRDLLQEAYILADEQIIQAQNEINKLSVATQLAEEPMDGKAKYAKAINDYLESVGEAKLLRGTALYDLIKRPRVKLKDLNAILDLGLTSELAEQNEIEIKYEGYIDKARKEAKRMIKMENMKLDQDIDYTKIDNLSLEARQKLNEARPTNLGQASRISGINPSDIQVLAIYMKEKRDADK